MFAWRGVVIVFGLYKLVLAFRVVGSSPHSTMS